MVAEDNPNVALSLAPALAVMQESEDAGEVTSAAQLAINLVHARRDGWVGEARALAMSTSVQVLFAPEG